MVRGARAGCCGEGVGGFEGLFRGVLELSSPGILEVVSFSRADLGFFTLSLCVTLPDVP